MNKFKAFFCLETSSTVSYILLFAKYLIYKSKAKAILPSANLFKLKFENRLKLEKIVALRNNRIEQFNQTWEHIL